jgi:hypothetical protein
MNWKETKNRNSLDLKLESEKLADILRIEERSM